MTTFILASVALHLLTGLTQSQSVPTSLKIGIEPEDVLEMEKIKRPLSIFIADSDGKLMPDLPGGTWSCSVTVAAGPGGDIQGTTSATFENGTATFPVLFLTMSGDGYILQFTVTHPNTAGVPAVNTSVFTVGHRPLAVKMEQNPSMMPGKVALTVIATIWDEALDKAADDDVLAGVSWDCSIRLTGKGNMMEGNTKYTVAPGNGTVIFEDVTIPKLGNGQALYVECFSPVFSTITGQSDPFIAYDFPRTGLLRKTIAKIFFTGPYDLVEAAIVAYNELGLYGKATCTGCPPGVLPKPKEKSVTPPPLPGWDPCTAPIFLNPDLSCTVEDMLQ